MNAENHKLWINEQSHWSFFSTVVWFNCSKVLFDAQKRSLPGVISEGKWATERTFCKLIMPPGGQRLQRTLWHIPTQYVRYLQYWHDCVHYVTSDHIVAIRRNARGRAAEINIFAPPYRFCSHSIISEQFNNFARTKWAERSEFKVRNELWRLAGAAERESRAEISLGVVPGMNMAVLGRNLGREDRTEIKTDRTGTRVFQCRFG